jgi:hypothetical protein
MKKILYLFMVLLAFASCKKSSFESVFDERPEVRMQKSIAEVNTILTTAPNGWIATLPTQAGGGYAFYIAFDAATQSVKMYGDMTDPSSTIVGTSTFRVKANAGAELIFDTYNYISLLDDPNPSSFGGATGSGLKSDVEFIFDHSTADSIIFTGKKYRQPFKLVKATAAQKASYDSGAYKTSIDRFKNFFATTKNPYIDVISGSATVKAGMSVNVTNNLTIGKRISFTGVLADNKTVLSGNAKFAFKLDGVDILGAGLMFNGVNFVKLAWKDATTLAFYDSTGKEYIIKSSPAPLTPFSLLFGFPTTFPYKKISIPAAGLAMGVTSGFNGVYQQMQALFVSSGRSVTSTTFTLTSNSILTVDVNYLSGTSAFVASATYNYTKVDGVITLDNNSAAYTANWNTRAIQIKPLTDYMLTGPFKVDWVISSDPNSPTLGGLYRTGDLSSFIYGTL